MKGVRAWSLAKFHPTCKDVEVVDIAGFAHLYCRRCRVLVNMEAVSPKFDSYNEPIRSEDRRTMPKTLLEVGE